MAGYRLLIKTSAAKELAKFGAKTDRVRNVSRIRELANDPRPVGSEKLAGYADRYRIRQGNYRVVYHIDDRRREVTVFKVADRKDAYR